MTAMPSSGGLVLDADGPQADLTRLFAQAGVQGVRACLVDLESQEFQSSWWIGERAQQSADADEASRESTFPGAAAIVAKLLAASPEDTHVRRLSPRRWGLVWRADAVDAVVAEVRYHDRRDALSAIDIALLRLVCGLSVRRAYAASDDDEVGAVANEVWPRVDRRQWRKPSRAAWWTVALPALAGSLCAWLLLVTVPAVQRTLAEPRGQIERTIESGQGLLVAALATALATGDYGVAQEELSRFGPMALFKSAVVANGNGRVVAKTGTPDVARIGDPVPAPYLAQARAIKLELESQVQGQLLFVPVSAPALVVPVSLAWLIALALLASVAATVLLVRRLLR